MASTTLKSRVALKIDTSTNWASSSLVLLKGEIAIEQDTRKFKIGDGVSTYSALPYAAGGVSIAHTVDPTTTDNAYEVGTLWLNTTNGRSFICQAVADGSATWIRLANFTDISEAFSNTYDTDQDGVIDKAATIKSGDSFIGVNDEDTSGLWTATKIQTELDGKVDDAEIADMLTKTEAASTYVTLASKGVANGVASLDESGTVPASQLPSYVDDVVEAANFEALPEEGEASKIYVTLDTNLTYRWSGSQYTEISASIALGETTGTAYEGSKGKQNADNIATLQTEMDAVEASIAGLGDLAALDTVSTDVIDAGAVTDEKIATVNANKLTQTPGDYLVFDCGNATA